MSATPELEQRVVPVASLHANPWNPNRMDDKTLQAERESIERYGFIDPVTVRPHPEVEGEWQIIDGEHRWRVATEKEMAGVPIVVLRGLSNVEAKKLTVILNETRGRADEVALGRLLVELRDEDGLEALTDSLRYDRQELKHLLAIGEADWTPPFIPDPDSNLPPGDDDFVFVAVKIHKDVEPDWRKAFERLGEESELSSDSGIAHGQALVVFMRAWLEARTIAA